MAKQLLLHKTNISPELTAHPTAKPQEVQLCCPCPAKLTEKGLQCDTFRESTDLGASEGHLAANYICSLKEGVEKGTPRTKLCSADWCSAYGSYQTCAQPKGTISSIRTMVATYVQTKLAPVVLSCIILTCGSQEFSIQFPLHRHFLAPALTLPQELFIFFHFILCFPISSHPSARALLLALWCIFLSLFLLPLLQLIYNISYIHIYYLGKWQLFIFSFRHLGPSVLTKSMYLSLPLSQEWFPEMSL